MNANPLWDFSLRHYAKTAVQQQCLQLQENCDANVNVVLFSLWLASLERVFEHDIVTAHVELQHWHQQVIVPLRQARCAAKQFQQSDSLYKALKKSELDAERVEQDMLCGLLSQFPEAPGDLALQALAQQNVRGYLQTLGLTDGAVSEYSEKLVAMVFSHR